MIRSSIDTLESNYYFELKSLFEKIFTEKLRKKNDFSIQTHIQKVLQKVFGLSIEKFQQQLIKMY